MEQRSGIESINDFRIDSVITDLLIHTDTFPMDSTSIVLPSDLVKTIKVHFGSYEQELHMVYEEAEMILREIYGINEESMIPKYAVFDR